MRIYEVEDLESAREFLLNSSAKIILTNIKGSTRYYGMRVIDYIFRTLKKEFPEKIDHIIINTYDDFSGFITASKLGYIVNLK